METEYQIIKGKRKEVNIFSMNEFRSIFKKDNWDRTFENPDFLKQVGLKPPIKTFIVAASGSSVPTYDGKVGGICVLRTDEKDKPYEINWNHWDFYQKQDKVVMVPKDEKRKGHWFKSEDEWKERIKKNPPHEDEI